MRRAAFYLPIGCRVVLETICKLEPVPFVNKAVGAAIKRPT